MRSVSACTLVCFCMSVFGEPLTECISAGVKNLSVAELNELLEEVETAVRRYSEELVQHLALRDELDFEKEVKNSFISVLIDVQNRQKEHRELLKKKRKLKNGVGSQHSRAERLPTSVSNTRASYVRYKLLMMKLQVTTKLTAYMLIHLSHKSENERM